MYENGTTCINYYLIFKVFNLNQHVLGNHFKENMAISCESIITVNVKLNE